MTMVIPAICSEIPERSTGSSPPTAVPPRRSRQLSDFRDENAYVLLGEPGSGKTTAFKGEASRTGGCFVSARNFLTVAPRPEWRDRPLYIDGLDEARALDRHPVRPFDRLRSKLDRLRPERFRISCRTSDWLASSDRKHLNDVVPNGQVVVLQLEPLSYESIVRILSIRPEVRNVERFLERVQNSGLEDLLKNPQFLDFFVRATARGEHRSPRTRTEVFQDACRNLVSEANREHEIASATAEVRLQANEALRIAGELFAIQLLAGKDGFASGDAEGYLTPSVAEGYPLNSLQAVLRTKLFRSDGNGPPDAQVPVHQGVAEFLAADFLSANADSGRHSNRVLSLILGDEMFVPSVHRGLAGWLASFDIEVRKSLIKKDPVCLLHGSLDEFTREQKLELMSALESRANVLELARDEIRFAACTDLATSNMQPHLKCILRRRGRSERDQALSDFVLRVLDQRDVLDDAWTGVLSDFFRDESRWPVSRVLALRLLVDYNVNRNQTAGLEALLDEVAQIGFPDPDGLLLSSLLSEMYPRHLGPDKALSYLPPSSQVAPGIEEFWNLTFPRVTRKRDIPVVLDELHVRLPGLHSRIRGRLLADSVLELLARGLEAFGDSEPIPRLYDWFSAAGMVAFDAVNSRAANRIRGWLEQRNRILRDLLREALLRPVDPSNRYFYYRVQVPTNLFEAKMGAGFGLWCLRQIASDDFSDQATETLFEWAVLTILDSEGADGPTMADVRSMAKRREAFRVTLTRLLPRPDLAKGVTESRSEVAHAHMERMRERLARVRLAAADLRQNSGSPSLLFELAKAYFEGHLQPQSGNGQVHLSAYLDQNQDLVQAAMAGLRGVPNRPDLPTAATTITLAVQDRIHLLGLPLLAGLAVKAEDGSRCRWSDTSSLLRSSLACFYTMGSIDHLPSWYQGALRMCPEVVAEIMLQYCRTAFRYRRVPSHILALLRRGTGHTEVASRICVKLLRSFPLRCTRTDTEVLGRLLQVALGVADTAAVRELLNLKLARTSMTVAQRGRWLIAGLIVDPIDFEDRVRGFVDGNPDRAGILAKSWREEARASLSRSSERVRLASVLIEVFGAWVAPDALDKGGWIGPEEMAAEAVRAQLFALRSSSDPQADCVLQRLARQPDLSAWKSIIERVRNDSRVLGVDRRYLHPTPNRILRVLRNGKPANARDLVALVADRLTDLGHRLRSRNTDGWRKYWNEDHNRTPQSPKHEESCRDVLLEELQYLLPEGVGTEPEAAAFANRRVDIRITSGGLQIPVEIKRHWRKSVASHVRSIRNQLIGKYANHSPTEATVGYGTYVILWFSPSSGPRTPEELHQVVHSRLSTEEKSKIGICVLDVSNPNGSNRDERG